MDSKNNIKLFTDILKDVSLAVVIEQGIKNFATEYAEINGTPFLTEEIYNSKINEILKALKKYPELVTNQKQAEEIVYKTPAELNPDCFESLLKKKEIEEYKKTNVKSSSAFKCSKCKKSKCSVTQKQIRAGDEPATTFVTCLECGHSFSFN